MRTSDYQIDLHYSDGETVGSGVDLKENDTEAQHIARVLRMFADMIEEYEASCFNDEHLDAVIEIEWIGD